MLFRRTINVCRGIMVICLFVFCGCQGAMIHPNGDHKTILLPDNGEILASNLSFDNQKGEIRYTLPQPALVRVRVGIDHAGALLRHVLDWEHRDAGTHVETWDKKDETGRVNFGERDDYLAVVICKPVNSAEKLKRSPSVAISFPGSGGTSPEGVPVVSGITPVRVTIHEEDSQRMAETKFEVAFYVDLVFLMEEEVGTNPFNYQLNVGELPEGAHVLTVNVIAYDGQVGTRSVKFLVKK